MEQATARTTSTTYKEKVRPTPAQARALEDVLWRCRDRYNTALAQRIRARLRRHGFERLVGALACLPGLWDQSASGPQRNLEHPATGAGIAIGGDTAFGR
jgi:hypothetical protein